jgi:hypothetical protein
MKFNFQNRLINQGLMENFISDQSCATMQDDLNVQKLIYNLRDLGFYGVNTEAQGQQLDTLSLDDI